MFINYVPRGTIIEAKVDNRTVRRMVARTLYCEINDGFADIEFEDPNENYGHYKSGYDKGRIIFPSGVVFDYSNTK